MEDPPQPHQLNWSYFKPEFSGKTEEDAVVYLLKTNDWMDTHNFPEDTKVRRFCRLVGISQEQNQILDCRQAFTSFKHGFFPV